LREFHEILYLLNYTSQRRVAFSLYKKFLFLLYKKLYLQRRVCIFIVKTQRKMLSRIYFIDKII